MRMRRGLLLILFMAFTACASNNKSTPPPSGSQSNAVQPSPKNNIETIQSASGEKCVIDESRICEEGTPGVTNDPFYAEGQDVRARVASGDETGGGNYTATLRYAMSLLQGDRPVNLFCGMNMHKHTVTYGQLATSGTPTDTDIAKLRAARYCTQ